MRKLHGLPEVALIDMGDFVGGMLKYLRRHPVPRVTIAGGVAKMTKLAQGLPTFTPSAGRSTSAASPTSRRAAGGSAQLASASSRPTRPPKPSTSRERKVSLSAMQSRARRRRSRQHLRRRPRHRARDRRVRSRRQALVGRAPFCDVRSTDASTEPAAIIRIVERAVAEILAPQARGRPE